MKKSNFVLVLVLFAVGMIASSCSTGKGCKGGGWYGDRNLTSVDSDTQPQNNTVTYIYDEACAD